MNHRRKSIRICLFFEFANFFGGAILKKIGGNGITTSYETQRKMLDFLGIEYTEKWHNRCDILQVNSPGFYAIHLIREVKEKGKKVIVLAHSTAEDFQNSFTFSKLIPFFQREKIPNLLLQSWRYYFLPQRICQIIAYLLRPSQK